jgi:hypothetical protein
VLDSWACDALSTSSALAPAYTIPANINATNESTCWGLNKLPPVPTYANDAQEHTAAGFTIEYNTW